MLCLGVEAYGKYDLGALKLHANIENRVKTYDVQAVEDKAEFVFKYSFSFPGLSILDFDACNNISCQSYRHYLTIATLNPTRLRWSLKDNYIPRPSCVPRNMKSTGKLNSNHKWRS